MPQCLRERKKAPLALMWETKGMRPGDARPIWFAKNLKKNKSLSDSCNLEIASEMWLSMPGTYPAVMRKLSVADIQNSFRRNDMTNGLEVVPLLIIATAAWLSL